MKHLRIAVLRGGPSNEYEVSLCTGREVNRALLELGYSIKDIVITKSNEWLYNGLSHHPHQLLKDVDLVFNALHGEYGEDGTVQRLLQNIGMPYTGSKALTSAITFNKHATKEHLSAHQVRMPKHHSVSLSDIPQIDLITGQIIQDLGELVFVKPAKSGSSVGTKVVRSHSDLILYLRESLPLYRQILIEELINGREATVGVIEGFRGEELYSLPVVEIVPPQEAEYFDHTHKYNGKTEEICPGRFTASEKRAMSEIAILAHKELGCRHYSRSDFIVKDGEVYFLEINTQPGLTSESLLPKAVTAVGSSFVELIDHLVKSAVLSK